jgi:hypothetical protein
MITHEEIFMHSLKRIALLVCVLALVPFAAAKNEFGIHDMGRVTFHSPTRVAGNLLPAGEYVVRHTMEGQEHVMVFEAVNHKVEPIKAKCQLVQLAGKADQTRTVYEVNGANERVLQELVFAGDTAKHVF